MCKQFEWRLSSGASHDDDDEFGGWIACVSLLALFPV